MRICRYAFNVLNAAKKIRRLTNDRRGRLSHQRIQCRKISHAAPLRSDNDLKIFVDCVGFQNFAPMRVQGTGNNYFPAAGYAACHHCRFRQCHRSIVKRCDSHFHSCQKTNQTLVLPQSLEIALGNLRLILGICG